jgi:hypothetical protein
MPAKKARAAASGGTRRQVSRKNAGFLDAFAKAGARQAHPHLDPLNRATWADDREVVLQKADRLLDYQRFLADARTVKAKRKGASGSFERSVLAQGQQARGDLDAFTRSTVRMVQQVNQTDLWNATLSRGAQSLRQTGPTGLDSMWAEVTRTEEAKTELARHGLSPQVAAAVTDALGRIKATVSSRDGKVFVEATAPGDNKSRRVALAAAARPTDLSQLLRRRQFDQLVSALDNDQAIYVEAVPTKNASAYTAPDLFAFGVAASRQRMHEHVRKLEDTGLATYEGNDPVSFIVGVIALAIFLGLVGSIILELCDDPDAPVQQPDWVCQSGGVLVMISLALLGGIAAIFFLDGVAVAFIGYIAFIVLLNEVSRHSDEIFPDFQPGVVPG